MKTDSGTIHYNLPALKRSDFDAIHTFVQACFDQGRQRFEPKLKTVSNNWEDFPEYAKKSLETRESMGVTMIGPTDGAGDFHLWMNPNWKLATAAFHNTLLHELVHGYAGVQYGHSAHWRRWFYRVRWHANEAKLNDVYLDNLKMHLFNVGGTYNKTNMGQEMDLIVEASFTAKNEHEKVLENYWSRIAKDSNRV